MVLISLERDSLCLRGTAVEVWRILDQPQSFQSLTESLHRRYRGSADQIRADIVAIFDEWERLGVLERHDNGPNDTAPDAGS